MVNENADSSTCNGSARWPSSSYLTMNESCARIASGPEILSGKRAASMGKSVLFKRELNQSRISGTSFTFMSVVAACACRAVCQPPRAAAVASAMRMTSAHSSAGSSGPDDANARGSPGAQATVRWFSMASGPPTAHSSKVTPELSHASQGPRWYDALCPLYVKSAASSISSSHAAAPAAKTRSASENSSARTSTAPSRSQAWASPSVPFASRTASAESRIAARSARASLSTFDFAGAAAPKPPPLAAFFFLVFAASSAVLRLVALSGGRRAVAAANTNAAARRRGMVFEVVRVRDARVVAVAKAVRGESLLLLAFTTLEWFL
mmetsp:Transcript_24514/g.75621  ORF Transcript_24514/g.75621 Transcript_24514/m.75621 type:complete len:323 (+) Transcript_24514:301-1269(+)